MYKIPQHAVHDRLCNLAAVYVVPSSGDKAISITMVIS